MTDEEETPLIGDMAEVPRDGNKAYDPTIRRWTSSKRRDSRPSTRASKAPRRWPGNADSIYIRYHMERINQTPWVKVKFFGSDLVSLTKLCHDLRETLAEDTSEIRPEYGSKTRHRRPWIRPWIRVDDKRCERWGDANTENGQGIIIGRGRGQRGRKEGGCASPLINEDDEEEDILAGRKKEEELWRNPREISRR